MKFRFRSIVSVIVILAMLLSLTVACGTSKSDNTDAQNTDAETSKSSGTEGEVTKSSDIDDPNTYVGNYDKPIKLSLATVWVPSPDTSIDVALNSELHEKVKKEFGLDIVPQYPSYTGYDDKLKILASANELPDVFLFNNQNLYRFVKDGALADTTEYYEKYPLLDKYLTTEAKEYFTFDGKRYGVINQASWTVGWAEFIRKDWLDNLGLSVPTNFNELEKVLYAFAKNDPDKNGKNDTYAFSSCTQGNNPVVYSLGGMFFVLRMFGTGPDVWEIQDNKWIHPFRTDNMKEAVAYIAKLYKDKVIDPESFTDTEQVFFQKQANGKFGIFMSHKNRCIPTRTGISDIQTIINTNPLAKPMAFKLPEPMEGKEYPRKGIPFSYHYQISASAGKNKEKMDRLFKFIAWQTTDQGFTELSYGKAGKHFKELSPEGLPIPFAANELTDQINADIKKFKDERAAFYIPVKDVIWWGNDKAKEFYKEIDKKANGECFAQAAVAAEEDYNNFRPAVYLRTAPSETEYIAGLTTKFSEITTRIITGNVDLEKGWQEWLDFFNKNGGPKIEEEAAIYNKK